MNTNTDFNKIDKVLSKISGKELKSFVMTYASSHDDFATALVEKYWKPERGNYKDMVEACFAHACVSSRRIGGPSLDWRKIEKDLLPVMRKAVTQEEWKDFLNQLWDEVEWEYDYERQRRRLLSRKRYSVIKKSIKQLIAENPENYYLKNYLGSLL